MARNAQDQIKKDGTLGYLARSASTPIVAAVAVTESIVRGDMKAPIANKISDGAANIGKSAGNAIVNHVTKNPVQTATQVASGLIVHNAINTISNRIDRLESEKNK